ncbi:AAA family ATPase [Candidatus Dependentiae bacterium]|nr:AAA family ATPase [Candidatus Dependentiae bacterium]
MEQPESFFTEIYTEIKKKIAGQDYIISRIIAGMLSSGHILIEGVPGLAKTAIVKTISECIGAKFQRIQFTPDLLPADLIGTLVYNQRDTEFVVNKGPIFANIILADEINRAPAKVQSALLEAMQEKQVTIGKETYSLPDPFLVLATQNPIEQEGTYPLPEAQIDRFIMKLKINYPNKDEEKHILRIMRGDDSASISKIFDIGKINEIKQNISKVYTDPKIDEYIVNIADATRNPENYGLKEFKRIIEFGVSPRASISLAFLSKTMAYMSNRNFVIPEDVKSLCGDVMRHRIILTYEAEAENISPDDVIKKLLDNIEVP